MGGGLKGSEISRDCGAPLVFPTFAHYGAMRSKMVRARVMLSAITDAMRGRAWRCPPHGPTVLPR
jgi:hypothetical protein